LEASLIWAISFVGDMIYLEIDDTTTNKHLKKIS
jgi:hypothetical protein